MTVRAQFEQIKHKISQAALQVGRLPSDVMLVAVSKTYDASHIRPVLEAGHRMFGENRVQEAKQKWPGLRKEFDGIELHLIGPLQSNKAAEAVALFDVIQTIDRSKIAVAIAAEIQKQGRTPKLFVQVNTGLEPQKAGIAPTELPQFLSQVRDNLGLKIEGLMCIPPVNEMPDQHFQDLRQMAKTHGLRSLSMGMSSDFVNAVEAGATHVRIGSAIFGARNYNTP